MIFSYPEMEEVNEFVDFFHLWGQKLFSSYTKRKVPSKISGQLF